MKKLTLICGLLLGIAAGARAQTWNIGPMGGGYALSSSVTATLSNGVLTISGTGVTFNFYNINAPTSATIRHVPWYDSGDYPYIITAVITDGVTGIGDNLLSYLPNLVSVSIPSSVTTIGSSAFWATSGLTSITIPNSITSIGGSAFSSCTALTSVTIGNSVTTIGDGAFGNCTTLTSIISLNPTPPTVGSNTFNNVPTSCCLRVPPSAITAYKTAAGWSNFSCVLPVTVRLWPVGSAYSITSTVNATVEAGDQGQVEYKWQRCQVLNNFSCTLSDFGSVSTSATYTIPANTHSEGQRWQYRRCASVRGCNAWSCTGFLDFYFY